MSVDIISKLSNQTSGAMGCLGVKLGSQGPVEDYRSDAVFGKGIAIGLSPNGKFIHIGKEEFMSGLAAFPDTHKLQIDVKNQGDILQVTVNIMGSGPDAARLASAKTQLDFESMKGGMALYCDIQGQPQTREDVVEFDDLLIESDGLMMEEDRVFGPICFAQYTLHRNKLKLTCQLSPIEKVEGHMLFFEVNKEGNWEHVNKSELSHIGRAIVFEQTRWNASESLPYRLRLELPLKDGVHQYIYQGTISAEPLDANFVKAAVFRCNFHYGFPDGDVVQAVGKLKPDLALFLGDQFYEGTGGFGAEMSGKLDLMTLDYLRKWYMFGWSYRALFQHIPCAIIPDDHDVYHGNVWGEGGKAADTSEGFGVSAQDSGGYKMPAEWVNMVQFTQTSHLPDPYDPTPVKQNIGVYYCHWNYAGISFAILEDRKFKSAPKHVLPPETEVNNGWIMNQNFDIKSYETPTAELLGSRQEEFLEHWVEDWSEQAEIKVVLSQTNFVTMATLPEGSKNDNVIPSLKIPEPGEYIQGDVVTVDMDSNGWPSAKRDKAVEIIRKGFAFHIAGDQHLASFVQ